MAAAGIQMNFCGPSVTAAPEHVRRLLGHRGLSAGFAVTGQQFVGVCYLGTIFPRCLNEKSRGDPFGVWSNRYLRPLIFC